jgi:hypothetical protein
MEKQKLIKFVQRIYNQQLGRMSPTDIYTHFVSEFPYTEYAESMTAKDVVISSFLMPFAGNPEVLDKKYDEVVHNLFAYSLIEVELEYSEVECPECYGNGYQECSDCYGAGKEDCSECGGSGEDEEGGVCSTCDGDGNEQCDYCDGDGQINCSECGGSGNYDDYDKREISQWYYVSYDTELMNEYLILDEWDEMNPESIYPNNKTIQLVRDKTSIEEPMNQTLESNDTYFYAAIDEPKFGKRMNGKINVDNLEEVY